MLFLSARSLRVPPAEPGAFAKAIGKAGRPLASRLSLLQLILVLDKKLSKLLIAPQARQELMRRLLRQTAAKGKERTARSALCLFLTPARPTNFSAKKEELHLAFCVKILYSRERLCKAALMAWEIQREHTRIE